MRIDIRMAGLMLCAGWLVASCAVSNPQTSAMEKEQPAQATFLSCDIRPELGGEADEHICVGSWGSGSGPGATAKAAGECTAIGGVVGNACDLSDAVAGCRGVSDGAEGSVTFTYWYYAGTLEKVTSSCSTPMHVVLTDTEAGATVL
jgi:hypothetical protein